MDGEDRMLWLNIVVPTASGPEYWQRNKRQWTEMFSQWPHFELSIVSSSTKLDAPESWVSYIFSGKVSSMARRFLGFSVSDAPFSLFLDDDCTVELRTLVRLVDKLRSAGSQTLMAGSYISPPSLKNGGRAFNNLCNRWLRGGSHFLGGAFCLPNSDFMQQISFGDIREVGGEEDRMAQELLARGGRIEFFEPFQVQHHCEKNFLQVIERAVRQGSVGTPSVRALPRWVGQSFGFVAGAALGRLGKLVRSV